MYIFKLFLARATNKMIILYDVILFLSLQDNIVRLCICVVEINRNLDQRKKQIKAIMNEEKKHFLQKISKNIDKIFV